MLVNVHYSGCKGSYHPYKIFILSEIKSQEESQGAEAKWLSHQIWPFVCVKIFEDICFLAIFCLESRRYELPMSCPYIKISEESFI